ncbi:MAG: hypothetical protein U0Q22_03885 [Acidimicrobiales bacterium]
MTGATTPTPPTRHFRSERGQVAGVETIPFAILVFVAGLLLVVNVWAVIDTRAAVDTAARDYLRAYTGAPDAATARARGRTAAEASLGERGRSGRRTIVDPTAPFGPCRPATVRITVEVPAVRAPFIGSIGTTTVESTQTELVQPWGDATAADDDRIPTPCDR